MIAFAYYLLKMFVCSGLLFSYYHLALRNKVFHQWNRFYLLVSIVLSLAVPCLQFNIWSGADNTSDIQVLKMVYSADEYVANVTAGRSELSLDQWIAIFYGFASAIVLAIFILALIKIHSIIRSHSVMAIDDIKFVNTEEKNAPFSFLNYVFWNRQIDLKSASGEHIFQHELVHVREKHSWDSLFLQLVLIAFWCNPFFWLIRRELKMIHEFIADKKSVGQADAHAFATMILQTVYPQHYTHLTNQFFHQAIKRRLAMLTKNNNPKLSYLSRVLALPLMGLLIMAFTIKQKSQVLKNYNEINEALVISDTLAAKQPSAFRAYKDKSIRWVYNDSLGKKISWNVAQKMGFIIDEKEFIKTFAKTDKDYVETILKPTKNDKRDTLGLPDPIIIIDGNLYGKNKDLNLDKLITPDKIQSLNVLKGETAIAKYGEKGKDGVIEIITKKDVVAKTLTEKINQNFSGEKPLIVIDGKESDNLDNVPADNIESITVLKGGTGIEKYGEKAKYGVIEISTKPAKNSTANKETIIEVRLDGVKIFASEKNLSDAIPMRIFIKAEEEAQFPGGVSAWRRFLATTLNAQVPSDKGAPTGSYTVELQFIVNADGSLADIKAVTKHGYGMEEEAVRALKNGPKWIPAQQNGKAVAAYRRQTITFVIAEG